MNNIKRKLVVLAVVAVGLFATSCAALGLANAHNCQGNKVGNHKN